MLLTIIIILVAFIVLDTLKVIIQFYKSGVIIHNSDKYKSFVYKTRWIFIKTELIRFPCKDENGIAYVADIYGNEYIMSDEEHQIVLTHTETNIETTLTTYMLNKLYFKI